MIIFFARFLDHRSKLQRDLAFLILSIIVATVLLMTGFADRIFVVSGSWGLASAFIAGVGFASVFFSVPATILIFAIAQESPAFPVALAAAFGSMLGDWLIFRFLRDGIADDIRTLIDKTALKPRLASLFRSRLFYGLTVFVAALLIASPLPDEFGLALFSALRFDARKFLPISFALNFLGIFIITLFAQSSSR